MNLSVNLNELMSAFESYNLAIWPMQVFAYLAGLVALYSALKKTQFSNNIASGILSFFWLWTGVVFCMFFWGPIYTAAYAFGVLFIAQGILFLINAIRPRLSFVAGRNRFSWVAALFIAYAMIGYPAAGYLLGHVYPRSLPFGLVPCPTTIFTIGMLMLTDKTIPKSILFIPGIWSIVAVVPVLSGIYEDAGLVITGLVCIPMLLRREKEAPVVMTNK